MKTPFAAVLAAALGLTPLGAPAQSMQPSAMPMTAPTPPAGSGPTMSTPAPVPAMSEMPSPTMPTMPRPSASPSAQSSPNSGSTSTNGGSSKNLDQIKKLQSGTLSSTDLRYALTHPLVEVNKVRKMKNVSFDKLRVYRLSSGLKSMLKIGERDTDTAVLAVLGPGVLIAQTSGAPSSNGSNSPMALLQYVLANVNVSNALNNVNVLNNSTVNVGVTLQDVLNGNKISLGQVAGIFVNGLGIITTITK